MKNLIKAVCIIALFFSTMAMADEEDPAVVAARHARAKAMQQQSAQEQQGEVDYGAYSPQPKNAAANAYINQLRIQAQQSGNEGDSARREFANRELDRISGVATMPAPVRQAAPVPFMSIPMPIIPPPSITPLPTTIRCRDTYNGMNCSN